MTSPHQGSLTCDVAVFEQGLVSLAYAADVLSGDVVDFGADALHRVLGHRRHMGATLLPQVVQAVLGDGKGNRKLSF